MSHQYSTASKVGTVLWSVAIGVGIIALGAAVLLPSTKSARVIGPREYDETPATLPTTQEAVPKGYRRVVMPGSKSDRVILVPDETQSANPPATQSTSQAK